MGNNWKNKYPEQLQLTITDIRGMRYDQVLYKTNQTIMIFISIIIKYKSSRRTTQLKCKDY